MLLGRTFQQDLELAFESLFLGAHDAGARRQLPFPLERGKIGSLVGIDVYVLAVLLELIHLFRRAQLKALKQERCLQPRPIELGDVHAELQITNIDSLLHSLSFPREAR